MNPQRGMAAHAMHSPDTTDLLRSFMQAHSLGIEELARLLCASPQTLEHWFEDGTAPPAYFLALTLALGTPRGARDHAQCARQSDSEKERALKMVRAI